MSMRAVGGFLLGFLIAISLVWLYVMSVGGTAESFDTRVDAHTTHDDRGLIATTYRGVAERLAEERNTVVPVRGDLSFRVQNIVWQDGARPTFARAAEMRGRIDVRAAGRGDIVVRGVNIRNADVFVQQSGNKEWNYRRALDRLLGESSGEPARRSFIVLDAAVQNVDVRVERPNQSFSINDVAAQLPRIDFAAPGLDAPRAVIARATGILVAGDSSYPVAANDARLEFAEGQMNFAVAQITTGETRIANFTGSFGQNFPGYGLIGEGRVERLRFQDVRFASPRLPAAGTAQFDFRIVPINRDLTQIQLSNANMESEGSRVTGSATIRFGANTMILDAVDARFDPLNLALVEKMMGDTLPYQGTITGTARGTGGNIAFDVATRLTTRTVREPLIAQVTGAVRFGANGLEVRNVEALLRDAPLASLRGIFPGLPLKGTISGRFALSGAPGTSPLRLNVRTEIAGGVAVAEGTVDLTGVVPVYNIDGRLIGINLQEILAPDAPPVFVTTRFTVDGSGTDPKTLSARVHVDGRFTGWRTGPQDTIHVAARVQNGVVTVDSAALRLATMTASANGEWRFVAPASGAIEYRVAFEPVTPFGPYIPVIGAEEAAGDLRVAGTVTGELGRLQVAGSGEAREFKVGDWSTSSLDSKYLIVLGPAVPEIDVQVDARDLRTPTAGSYETAEATVRLVSPAFALDVRAERASGEGGLELVADGRIPATGAREIVMHRARIDFGSENWALTQPATFSWAGPNTDLFVRGLEMRRSDRTGLLKLEGRVLPLANADFRLETTALPVGDIQRLFGRRPLVGGALSTLTTVRTIAGVPQLTSTFQLDSATIENIRFTQLVGDASYVGRRLIANATARVDTAGALQFHAELPMELNFGPERVARLLDTGPVNVTLVTDSISLAPFGALSPDIEDLTGILRANMRVTGTVQEPLLSGEATVRNASVHVARLNQDFDSINARVVLDNRTAVFEDFIARSGGFARVGGNIEFRELNNPILDVTVLLSRFELIGVDNQDDAQASGEVQLTGPLGGVVMTGAVLLEEGHFPIPQTGASAMDSELAQFEANLPAPGEEARQPFYEGLRINGLRVTAGNNLWFSMADARAELAGTLIVNKRGDELRVTGDLTGQRGTYVLRAGPILRRFEVTRATIRFLGGEQLNPAVDITARRRVIDQEGNAFDIDVRIGGTLLSPTLALASESAAPIPQSELLSFLLFGQPSFALGGASPVPGGDVLEQALVGGISELFSLQLEQTLIDQLGTSLDIFQIRLGGSPLDESFSPSLIVGEEISPNLFLTVEAAVHSLFGSAQNATKTFAVHLEWRITDVMTLRGSYEPVNEIALLRGFNAAFPTDVRYQKTIELRRRWTW
jgi:hypothetical protein